MKPNELATIRSLDPRRAYHDGLHAPSLTSVSGRPNRLSSIPAAVISMAILSAFKDSTILENNIVQTVASAAGKYSGDIIFVLPDSVIVGCGTDFLLANLFFIRLSGVPGVVLTIWLRRAYHDVRSLLTSRSGGRPRRWKVGSARAARRRHDTGAKRKEGLRAVILGSVASAGLAVVSATRVIGAIGGRH